MSDRNRTRQPRSERGQTVPASWGVLLGIACLSGFAVVLAGTPTAAKTAASAWQTIPAAAEAAALAADAPTSRDYPEADVLVLYRNVSVEIADDGRVTRREHTVGKLLTHWAVRNRSDVRVAWDAERQDLQVTTCRTIMRDGRVVTTPDRGFNEVTPSAVAQAAAFVGIREMVISHVGTEIGCVVELDFTISDRQPPPLPPSGAVYLQGSDPILVEEVATLSARPLQTAAVHGDAIAVATDRETLADGRTVQRWTAHDVPGLATEGNRAHRGDYLPHVLYAAADNWRTVATAWQEATQAAAQVDASLAAWLDETPPAGEPPALTPRDDVERIARLVADGVRTVELPTGSWSRLPRPAGEVYDSACGSAWEKGVLAVTLLSAVGLQPELGFFSTFTSFTDVVPATVSFDQVRVVVAVAGDNYWFDPNRSDIWPGRCDLGGHTGLFLESEPAGFRTYQVANRRGESLLTVAIAPDAAESGALTAVVDLVADGVLWPDAQDADELAAALAADLLAESEVTDIQTERIGPYGVRMRVAVRGSSLAQAVDGLVFYRLPTPPALVADRLPHAFDSAQRQRTTPLFVAETCREELRLILALPADQVCDYVPPECDLSSDHARYKLAVQTAPTRIELTRVFEISPGRVEPDRYGEFRSIVNTALQPNAQQIVIRQP